jgi:hypothetical protein
MTPEGKVKTAIKKVLTSIGAYQHWPVQNGMGAPCLDCHGCYRGTYFAIEAKAPGKLPTPRQEETIKKIVAAEGMVMVISSVEGAQNIKSWLEEHVSVARRNLD